MEAGDGLSEWKSESLDLERPLSAGKETKRLQQVPHELLIIEGNCIGLRHTSSIGLSPLTAAAKSTEG